MVDSVILQCNAHCKWTTGSPKDKLFCAFFRGIGPLGVCRLARVNFSTQRYAALQTFRKQRGKAGYMQLRFYAMSLAKISRKSRTDVY